MQYLKRKFRVVQYPKYTSGSIPIDSYVADGVAMFYRVTEEESEFIMDKASDDEMNALVDCFMLEEVNYTVIKKALMVLNKYLDLFETRKAPLIPFSTKKKIRDTRYMIRKWWRHQLFVLGLPGGVLDMGSSWWKKKTDKMEREYELKMSQNNDQNNDGNNT